MKHIKTFDDKDNIYKIDFSDISTYIREEIDLGNTKPYEIKNMVFHYKINYIIFSSIENYLERCSIVLYIVLKYDQICII